MIPTLFSSSLIFQTLTDGGASPQGLEVKTRNIRFRSVMWQEVIHRLNANLLGGQEVKIQKTELYSHALIQDILVWAIMSPHAAAAAEARNKAAPQPEHKGGGGGGEGGAGGGEDAGKGEGGEGGASVAPDHVEADDRPKNVRTSMS